MAVELLLCVRTGVLMSVRAYLPSAQPGLGELRQRLGLSHPADELWVFTAHASYAWITGMADVINAAGAVQMRVGLDLAPHQSGVDALTELAKHRPHDIAVVKHVNGALFHPKLYAARHGDVVSAVVGSSNASSRGFERSVEANVAVQAAQNSPDARMVQDLIDGLEAEIGNRVTRGIAHWWRLPGEQPPPVVRGPQSVPTAGRDPQVAAWQLEQEYIGAEYIADFVSPLSGVVDYVLANGHQGGFDIPSAQMQPVEALIPQGTGAVLELRWKFLNQRGETVFEATEQPRKVVQSGYGGHNRVITAGKPLISRPLVTEYLQPANLLSGSVHVLYKLSRPPGRPPILWMVHTLPDVSSVSPEEV